MRRIALALSFLVAILFPAVAGAQERILSFVSDVVVRTDGSILVTETIAVHAERYQIKHGIYRDIPMRALDEWGLWSANGFDIVSIQHNGQPSNYRTEWIDRFVRIYIGDSDVEIPWGDHVYTIKYVTTRQLRTFDGYDEIYWNATGNFWDFPIEVAQARIHLPAGAKALQVKAYTGPFGAKGGNYRVAGEGGSDVFFAATRPLGPREGLSVSVGFTKGLVPEIAGRNALDLAIDNPGAMIFLLGWIGFPIYLLYAWVRVGRDPTMENVIPLFHPPENLTPSAMSYVHFKGFKSAGRGCDLAFIAALLALGVKRLLKVEEEMGDVVFKRADGKEGGAQGLASGERALFDSMFAGRSELPVTKGNGPRLQSAQRAMRSAIANEFQGRYFRFNFAWFAPAAIVGAVTFVLGLILQKPPEEGIGAMISTAVLSAVGCAVAAFAIGMMQYRDWAFIRRVVGIILIFVGAGVTFWAVFNAFDLTALLAYRVGAVMVAAGVASAILMLHLIRAPTQEGAKVLSRIEGFKLYLETAEANRLNLRDAPQMSEELFEKYLPYAAGLGVEEPWSEAYAAHLQRVAPESERRYEPSWYHGSRWSSDAIGRSTAASVAAISSAMASAMPQPKSSSGSSGGGRSGGGGGGGGGGGW